MLADEVAQAVAAAPDWDARVAQIRLIPEHFGLAVHQEIFSEIAKAAYVPNLAPDFAYVHWREEYELRGIESAYAAAAKQTDGFTTVDPESLERAIMAEPVVLRIFRLFLGFTAQEFAAATALVTESGGQATVSVAAIRSMETGRSPKAKAARWCAQVIHRGMRRELFGTSAGDDIRLKVEKPDTIDGWATVQRFGREGVPLPVFLHQRHYGGAFRQLLDATSAKRGDLIEDAVQEIFTVHDISFVRTGSRNQEEIATRFGLTVKPAPDFVVFDEKSTLRAILECKGANDGGTARDKAARFKALRVEANRLGGVPLFAVLAGLGWTRTSDALGPVVRDTDGRTFTIPTLPQMLTVQPFPQLMQVRF